MSRIDPLYIGIQGHVLALDRTTGEEIWRCRLKGSDFVNVVLQDGELYATAAGELFKLDPAMGEIRWQNPLKGLGRGLISIAAAANQEIVLSREKRRQEEADAASAGAAAV